MRALLVIVLVAAGLWGGYWVIGSRALDRSVEGWFRQHSGSPLLAEHSGIAVQGFPNRFDLTVTAPRLSDSRSGLGWSAPFLQVFMMTWKPWHLIAQLPHEQQITLPDQTVTLTSTQFQGSAVLVPTSKLALDRTAIVAEGLSLQSQMGWQIAASAARFATRRTAEDGQSHEIGVEITSLSPDAGFRMALQGSSTLPERIERLHLDARIDLSAPLDRHMAESRPMPEALVLHEVTVDWGDLRITGKGTVTPGPDGVAEGRIEFRIDNWRALVPVLVAAGLITPQVTGTVTRAMELLAEQDGTADVLDLPLVLQNGRMSLGPIPLGPAPLLR